MSQSQPKTIPFALTLMLLAPTLGALVTSTASAQEGEPVRALAVYHDFASVPYDADFAAFGVESGYRFSAIPAVLVRGPPDAIESLRTDGRLEQIVYDEPVELNMETAVVATKARDSWGNVWHAESGIAPILKDGQAIDGRGVVVGVVDSGVNAAHPDLWYAPFALADGVTPAPKVLACVHTSDFVITGPLPVEVPHCDATTGHGTHVAGIVAGSGMMADMGFSPNARNGVNDELNGAAPGAQLVVAGLGVETVALGGLMLGALAGLDYMYANADRFGIRVVTNSWSFTNYNCNYATGSWKNDGEVTHAITNKLVLDKGITVLWAANNAGGTRPLGTSPSGRNTMPGVINVANYDDLGTGTRDGNIAGGSGDGCVKSGGGPADLVWTWPDVAAPGTNIVSTASGPDGVFGQTPIFVGANPNDAPFYTTLSGTSMATPHVAGVVALMYQAYPEITPAQVEEILIKTATPWADNVATRNVTGTTPYWGPTAVNNAANGFTDPTQCRITPAIAQRAESNDATLDALYPGFRDLVQPRIVNGRTVDVDAELFVCRDYKRGRGLIDAEAAVREALALAGDDDGEGEPAIKITAPDAGEVVTEAQLLVEGVVDRLGDGPNTPPVAVLAASATSGPAPLQVDLSLGGSDADGAIVSFSLDFGDGSAPLTGATLPGSTVAHTYAADGTYTARLTVTDDEGATGEATVTIRVGGLPETNVNVAGSMFAYNEAVNVTGVIRRCPGVSNVVALATGAAVDDAVPKYVAGTRVCLQARFVSSTDPNVPVTTTSTATVRIFDASGNVVFGPAPATPFADTDPLGGAAVGFDGGSLTLPSDWSGRYWLAFAVDSASGPAYVHDTDNNGLKPLDVLSEADVLGRDGDDSARTIGDPDDDGATAMGEILWADASTDAESVTVVLGIKTVPPQNDGNSPTIYVANVNGREIESYLYGFGFGPRIWDDTASDEVLGASTRWDRVANTVTITIPRTYLASVDADCPCSGHVEVQAGPPFLGGQPTVDRAPDAGERPLAAAWQLRVGGIGADGSSSDPENSDATGDTPLPHTDVTKIWVSGENATHFDLTLAVANLASAPPSATIGGSNGVSTNYGAEFCVDNAAQTYTAATGPYAGLAGVVCYRLGASNGILGPQHSGGVIQKDGTASCGLSGVTSAVAFNNAASTITWSVQKSGLNVDTISGGLSDCNSATGPTRNARAIAEGDVLSRTVGQSGMSAGVLLVGTLNLDGMAPANARPYTFTGGDVVAELVANAGAGYAGSVGDSIAILGTATGGTEPYACAWSAPGGSFADASACATSVVFDTPGTKTLTLQVTDGAGATALATAPVVVASDVVERVEVVVGGRSVSTPVTTSSAEPTEAWSALVDVAGLPNGETDIVATWYDADGAVLASATRSIVLDLDGVRAFVEILAPGDGSEVSGVSVVSGTAGHAGGDEATSASLNHYGFPLGSGLRGARAQVVLEGEVLVPCATCQPGQLQKPVGAIPNAVWNPVSGNLGPVVNPVLFNNLATSSAWTFGPDSPSQGVDGYWFSIAGHGGDDFTLEDEFDVQMDIRFYNDWLDGQSDELGGVNGGQMPKSGRIPDDANWAFVYMRKGTQDTALDQVIGIPVLTITPVIVPPGPVQALAAASGPGSVTLTWAPPLADGGEILGYKVLRDGALLATPATTTYVDAPGDTATHVYAVVPYNSAGEGPSTAVSAAAGDEPVGLSITNPDDGALAVPATTTIDGTYTPSTGGGGGGGGSSAFANTHYFAILNLNDPSCGGDLGYGDHVIFERLTRHAIESLGVPANNVHVYHETGGAPVQATDRSNWAKLPNDWKSGAAIDGPARWSVVAPALRAVAAQAAAAEAAGGAPARLFVLESSHGLQASVILGDGATDSIMCLVDADVSSTELGDLLNDIDADVAQAHPGVAIEWSINIDCSFCGGFADSPLPAPQTTPVYSAGVVGPNRVVEVGCAWVTECFGNPAITYDYMFNRCTFTGDADGYGPIVSTVPGTGPDGGDIATDLLLPSATHHAPDGAITLEEAYWCALDRARTDPDPFGGNGPWAPQQNFQLSDLLETDLFQLDGFVLWEVDSSLDLREQDPDAALDLAELALPDTRLTDPTGDSTTPFTDLTSLVASANAENVLATVGVADLTLSSLEAEDVIEYRLTVNGDAFGACYSFGSVFLWGYDIPTGTDPVTGEETSGAESSGTAVYDMANGLVAFQIPRAELNDATLPAEVSASSHYGECTLAMPVTDDTTASVMTSEEDEDPVEELEDRISVVLSGPTTLSGDATLDPANGTWSYDPPGELAAGSWTATATHSVDDGTGFRQVGAPASVQFTIEVPTDITPPTPPGTPVVLSRTASSISFEWAAATDNVGVDRYEVLRGDESLGTTTGTSFTDTGLAAGTEYTYRVRAFDAAGNSATSGTLTASTQTITRPVGTLTLRVGETLLGEAEIDLAEGDPASWSIEVDWRALPSGTATLVADYDDGEGLSASDSITVTVTPPIAISITDPAPGERVLPSFRVSGTTEGTGGPDGVDASTFMIGDGTFDPYHAGLALARGDALPALEARLAGAPGFLGVAPDLEGAPVVRAYFTGAAPAAPEVALPAGWTLEMVGDLRLEPALKVIEGSIPTSRARDGPPVPAQATGIGPGSFLISTMKYAPGFVFLCTANFVWQDSRGDYYLGAAGHCWLPNPINGGPQLRRNATHGAGADYDPTDTTVTVCVANCVLGGTSGAIVRGTMVTLGHPAYARQTDTDGNRGNDFGIVKIPRALLPLVRPEVPVWNGPVSEGSLSTGEPVLLYGNAAGLGETHPTRARAGFGGLVQNAKAWSAFLPSFQGDSGSALTTARATAPDTTLVEGGEAVGILTHLVVGTAGPVGGTTMPRAKQMALEAGITIRPVLEGETIAPPPPTPPTAPLLETLTPGTTTMGLSWSPPAFDGNSPVTGYTIRYGTSAGAYTETVDVGNVLSHTVTGLSPATEYFFVVAAKNAVGTGPDSNELSASTSVVVTPPSAPQNVLTAPGNGSVTVSWDPPANDGGSPVTGYLVQYTGGPSGSVTTGADARMVDVTGLVNGREYTFSVSAINSAGAGEPSAPRTETPNGPPPPAYTVEVRADAGDVEVFGWRAADSYDGSSFQADLTDAPGGALTVTARVLQDGVPVAEHAVDVHVLSPPDLTLPASVAGRERELVEFVATATDPDGEGGLTFSLVEAPAGAQIGAVSGRFSWTPDFGDAGTHAVRVRVTDPEGLSDESTTTLSIGPTNRPPVLDPIGDRVVGEGETLSFTLTASDFEGGTLTYSAETLPTGAQLDGATGEFTWTPAFGMEGNHPVRFLVTDDAGATDDERIFITVGNVNRPPVLDPIGPKLVAEAQPLTFLVTGSDPDAGDALAFTATGTPTGASFVGGTFAWTPTYAQAGTYNVTFRVSDGGGLWDEEVVEIRVANVDRAPVLQPIIGTTVRQLTPIAIPVVASDADGDTIRWAVNGHPNASVEDQGGGRGILRWTPALTDIGAYTLTVYAISGELSDAKPVLVTVLFHTDLALGHASPSVVTASPGQVVQHRLLVRNTGPQEDTFRLSARNAAGWAVGAFPPTVTVPAGGSVEVTIPVTAGTNVPVAATTLTAVSLGDGTTTRTASFRIDVPYVVTLGELEQVNGMRLPRGVVHVAYLNGAAAEGADVTVTQTALDLGALARTSQSGRTNAEGDFAYDLSGDPRALLPGNHQLVVTASRPGGPVARVTTTYAIGAAIG